jgi:hypothetical protein
VKLPGWVPDSGAETTRQRGRGARPVAPVVPATYASPVTSAKTFWSLTSFVVLAYAISLGVDVLVRGRRSGPPPFDQPDGGHQQANAEVARIHPRTHNRLLDD